ncbi:hypothetical protein BOTBODRAFT_36331 [Botryobasidium botryosum FD-172 SS1]|uniref:Protein kinase domain-containing protein n=1 Tax=Botryobasidium botryosum (strain FD-172 SS1) TaxID=930990 RepID=A0A067MEZ5_BOTB1|nr:hypothetical protein BOTBODRAFT_36331 [Botryobasidium botryosum FD-172 SS1]
MDTEVKAAGHRQHLGPDLMAPEQDRHMLIVEELLPLNSLSGAQYLDAWVEIVEHLENLHKHGVLHRNISFATLVYRKTGTAIHGVLTDFDLATSSQNRVDYPFHLLHRTGTMPFLARELLEIGDVAPHLLRHDLESALYVLVWDIANTVAPGATANIHLQKWLDPTTSASAKGAVGTHLAEPTLISGQGIPLGNMDPLRIPLGGIFAQLSMGYNQLLAWRIASRFKPRTGLHGDNKKSWESLWDYFVTEAVVQKFRDFKQASAQSH